MVDMEFYWGVNASTIYNLHSYANCPLLACSRIHIFGQLQDGVNSWQNLVWRSGLKLLLMERTNKCFSTTATQLSFHKLCMQAGVWHIWLVVLSYRNNKPQNTPKSTPKGCRAAGFMVYTWTFAKKTVHWHSRVAAAPLAVTLPILGTGSWPRDARETLGDPGRSWEMGDGRRSWTMRWW